MVLITDPSFNTFIFGVIFTCVLLATIRKKKSKSLFPLETTNELKGLAILLIVFSHIGYILASDDRFLWPLSTMAGVGVNLFLFLSGYGLSISSLKKSPTIKLTYQRLLRLFVPLWIVLTTYFVLDYFMLHIEYGSLYIVKSFSGLFLRADALGDVNSVLWYFSLILFYYLLFPLVFMAKRLWASALIVLGISLSIVMLDLNALSDVMRFYQIHTLAFPLGMFAAWLTTTKAVDWLANARQKSTDYIQTKHNGKLLNTILYVNVLGLLLCAIAYAAIHSKVDSQLFAEQLTSLLTMTLIIVFFIVKRFYFGLFTLFGIVSFEVYLLHWPLISRYDFLYMHVPSWLATVLYLVIFVALAWVLKLTSEKALSYLPKTK